MPLEKKSMPRPLDMEKYHIHAIGYELPLVQGCNAAVRSQDRNYRVYGRSGDVSYIELDGGSLTMDVIHAPEMQVLDEILTEQKPDAGLGFEAFYPAHDVITHVTKHLKDETEQRYVRAEFYPYWHSILEPVAGSPGSYGSKSYAGLCDTPIAFQSNVDTQGVAILTDLIALSGPTYNGQPGMSGNFTWYNPTPVPVAAKGYAQAGKYALMIELQKRGLDGVLSDSRRQCKLLRISQNMVQSVAGSVLSTPVVLTGVAGTAAVAGSSLPMLTSPATYWYKVSALDQAGETLASTDMASGLNPTANDSKNTLTLTRVTGAVKYNLYRATSPSASAPSSSAYSFLETIEDPGSGTTFTVDDTFAYTNNLKTLPAANSTGQGIGRVVITPSDLKGTGWNVGDADGLFYAFVHFLYVYAINGTDPYLIGDGLNNKGRWD